MRWVAGAVLLTAGGAFSADVSAQCDTDPTPRLVWTYPAAGQEVSRFAPVLIRFIGTRVGLPTYRTSGSNAEQALPIVPDLSLIDFVAGTPLPENASVIVKLTMSTGAPLELAFTTSSERTAEQPVSVSGEPLELVVAEHFVGDGMPELPLRCREILAATGGLPCMTAFTQVGFDVELRAAGSSQPAQIRPHAFEVLKEGGLSAMAGLPRLWPAECGRPRLLGVGEVDVPSLCVRIVALVDGISQPQQVIRSEPYCLGDGQPWPPEPPDAGTPLPDAGAPQLPPVQPPLAGTVGFCGCNCPPGVPTACDYVNPPGSAGRNTGTGNGLRNAGSGGSSVLAQAGAGGGASAAGNAQDEAGGCGCRIAERSRPSDIAAVGLIAVLLGLARRRV